MPATAVPLRPNIRPSPSPTASVMLGVVIVALSSAAPFIRFGGGGVSLSANDVANALLFTLAWVPFVLLAAVLGRTPIAERVASHWLLAICIVLLPFVAIAHTALYFGMHGVVYGPADSGSNVIPYLVLSMLGALQYLVAVALFLTHYAGQTAYRASIATAELQVSHARLQQDLTASRLAVLQAQLQPHFLFNALNSISALVSSDPPAARRMLIDLSALLRMVLESSDRQSVPFEQEVELIRHYLAIQQVRFGDRLSVEIDVDTNTRQLAVPPMLLQPIVENAVHHAMTSHESNVVVHVIARAAGGRFVIEVVNSGPSPADDRGSVREGVGLRNTRERLQQLFGNECSITLGERTGGGGATARIEVPARPASHDTMLPESPGTRA